MKSKTKSNNNNSNKTSTSISRIPYDHETIEDLFKLLKLYQVKLFF